jgi:hypothetical protein
MPENLIPRIKGTLRNAKVVIERVKLRQGGLGEREENGGNGMAMPGGMGASTFPAIQGERPSHVSRGPYVNSSHDMFFNRKDTEFSESVDR